MAFFSHQSSGMNINAAVFIFFFFSYKTLLFFTANNFRESFHIILLPPHSLPYFLYFVILSSGFGNVSTDSYMCPWFLCPVEYFHCPKILSCSTYSFIPSHSQISGNQKSFTFSVLSFPQLCLESYSVWTRHIGCFHLAIWFLTFIHIFLAWYLISFYYLLIYFIVWMFPWLIFHLQLGDIFLPVSPDNHE